MQASHFGLADISSLPEQFQREKMHWNFLSERVQLSSRRYHILRTNYSLILEKIARAANEAFTRLEQSGVKVFEKNRTGHPTFT